MCGSIGTRAPFLGSEMSHLLGAGTGAHLAKPRTRAVTRTKTRATTTSKDTGKVQKEPVDSDNTAETQTPRAESKDMAQVQMEPPRVRPRGARVRLPRPAR